ncbi:hypothetical protein TRIATDRAFT_217798 [Trichoderma atroviride IMI 206040]|uniref:Uncharacterized protein n=2 Tax=Hypocrea atroviridis TaxID=63577 RepID=G9NQA4_HYPAI|nr:uncharacterized protein TRIATDRAFT_217798 [Trichoderma atroviride IMI 206040]EHK47249.1 hypothetical protein TRIATDRAFT_217798 [Trichoderma atroviride IMI 206040]
MDRYDDIRPFAQNRVKLQVPENTSDYVNASPIILTSPSHPSQPPLRYIAMKEPTRASIDHVWRMVAEQTSSPAVIVQISTMVEVTMSTLYFPENEEPWNLNKSNLWGDDWKAKLSVISSEIDNGGTEKSKLLLHVHGEEEPRVVWHYLYTRWDTYSPYSLDHLGGLVEVMKSSWQHNSPSNPRIIHCDDGSGRTSVFIALDHLIRELNFGALASYNLPQEGDDPVYNTVEILYQQRQNMVHRQAHYLLLYEAMKKLWHDKYGVVAEEGSGESAAWRREESSPREQCIDGA